MWIWRGGAVWGGAGVGFGMSDRFPWVQSIRRFLCFLMHGLIGIRTIGHLACGRTRGLSEGWNFGGLILWRIHCAPIAWQMAGRIGLRLGVINSHIDIVGIPAILHDFKERTINLGRRVKAIGADWMRLLICSLFTFAVRMTLVAL